jgi:hypothetical protein
MNAALADAYNLYQQHLGRKFPKGPGGEEIDGIDLVLLGADTAGCISTFFGSRGTVLKLDPERTKILKSLCADLERVVPRLSGEAQDYFTELHRAASIVSNHLAGKA